jgi:hypothetical protein
MVSEAGCSKTFRLERTMTEFLISTAWRRRMSPPVGISQILYVDQAACVTIEFSLYIAVR